MAKYQRTKRPDKTTIDYKESYEQMEKKEWSNAARSSLGLGEILKLVLMKVFPKRKKVIEEVMKDDNIALKQRARIAYILDAIDEDLMKDLGIIHDIRNKFVHDFNMKFANGEICRFVRKLSTVKSRNVRVTKGNCYELYERCIRECLDKINDIAKRLKEGNS